MIKGYARKASGLLLAAALVISTFTACGGAGNDEVISTTESFLSAAQSADLTAAANYATPEVIDQLGWSDEDINDVINDFYAAIAGYGISEEELMAIPEVEESVDAFISKIKTSLVSSYEIDKASVKNNNGVSEIKATVNTFSENDFYSLLDDELINEITEFSTNYAKEHEAEMTDASAEDQYSQLYTALVPFVMDKMTASLESLAGSREESWGMTLEKKDGKLLVTGVYDASTVE